MSWQAFSKAFEGSHQQKGLVLDAYVSLTPSGHRLLVGCGEIKKLRIHTMELCRERWKAIATPETCLPNGM
jgi:hypothetical protein